jgi:hypothetical protein
VTKPALDLSGSGCVTADALCEFLSDGVGTVGGVVDEDLSLAAEHNFTSEICDFSQPENEVRFSQSSRENLIDLTVIRPLLSLSVDATRAPTQRRTPVAIEFDFVVETRRAVGEVVARRHRCQPVDNRPE